MARVSLGHGVTATKRGRPRCGSSRAEIARSHGLARLFQHSPIFVPGDRRASARRGRLGPASGFTLSGLHPRSGFCFAGSASPLGRLHPFWASPSVPLLLLGSRSGFCCMTLAALPSARLLPSGLLVLLLGRLHPWSGFCCSASGLRACITLAGLHYPGSGF